MIPHIDSRLWEWVEYVDQRLHAGLGYKSRTVEWEAMQLGGKPIKGTGPILPKTNERAEEIENAIVRLPDYLRQLVYIRYLCHAKFPTDDQKCRKLGYSAATYRTYTTVLHNRIEAYLEGAQQRDA